jgi:hypothetical protein
VAVFELGGALAPALSELAIGPWTHAPGIAAFDSRSLIDAGAERAESLWRVELARRGAGARAALAGGERSIARTHAVLDGAPRRIDRALATGAPDLSSFAVDEPGRLEQALQHAAALARGRARVETRLEGALVARSTTTLSADVELWVAPGLSRAGAELHARSVAVAARTRHAWARILALVVTWGRRLAALGLSAGLSALPALWRFLRDLLRAVRDPDTADAR